MIQQSANKRPKSIISSSNAKQNKYLGCLKGDRAQTKQLNINVKTYTSNHLHVLQMANELSTSQLEITNNYSNMSACFEATSYLFLGYESSLRLKKMKNSDRQHFEFDERRQRSRQFEDARSNIKKYCHEYYRSTQFIRNFMRSPRMHFKNKLIMIKYLEKIELLPIKRYKQKQCQWKKKPL